MANPLWLKNCAFCPRTPIAPVSNRRLLTVQLRAKNKLFKIAPSLGAKTSAPVVPNKSFVKCPAITPARFLLNPSFKKFEYFNANTVSWALCTILPHKALSDSCLRVLIGCLPIWTIGFSAKSGICSFIYSSNSTPLRPVISWLTPPFAITLLKSSNVPSKPISLYIFNCFLGLYLIPGNNPVSLAVLTIGKTFFQLLNHNSSKVSEYIFHPCIRGLYIITLLILDVAQFKCFETLRTIGNGDSGRFVRYINSPAKLRST